MIAGVVSYMLLCWRGGVAGLVSLTSSPYPSPYSPYSSELLFSAGVGLPSGFCYVCVCVGLGHLVLWKWVILLSKLEDGRYRPKHVVFPLLINTII